MAAAKTSKRSSSCAANPDIDWLILTDNPSPSISYLLRRGDPVVPMIHAALTLRRLAYQSARRAAHFIRGR